MRGANLDIDLATPSADITWQQSACPWNAAEGTNQHRCAVKNTANAPLRAAQLLLLLNGLLWIGLGIYSIVRFPFGDVHQTIAWVVVALMFANALVLLLVAWGLGRGSRFLFWLGLAQVAVNLLLSVTDQIGLWDLLVLLLNAITLALLFAQRRRFGVKW